MELPVADISHVIQLSLAPAFLLVAIGSLIMILTTRLGRIVDRRRVVLERSDRTPDDPAISQEVTVLSRRSNLIYYAILSAVLGALLVCLVVAGAFLGALLEVKLAEVVAGLFVLAMVVLVIAWSLLLREIYLAVRIPTHHHR